MMNEDKERTPPPQPLLVGSGDTIMKADVEKMIRDWQSECADHQALHNQGNVLLDRLTALKPSLAMNDFLTGVEHLAEEAMTPRTFSSDKGRRDDNAKAVAYGLQVAAALIDGNVIMDTSAGKVLVPRQEGNRDGLQYSVAIRALASAEVEG